MNTSENNKCGRYIFREILTPDELLEQLKLRYRVYRESRLSRLCPPNDVGLEFDCYDLTSRHFGLFLVGDRGERLVGAQRGVYPEGKHISRSAFEIVERRPALAQLAEACNRHELPCVGYMPPSELGALESYLKTLKTGGMSYAESSRFMIDPSYSSIRLAIFFARAVIAAYVFCGGADVGITQVASSHKGFYLRNGFRQLDRTADRLYSEIGLSGATLAVSRDSVIGSVARTIRVLSLQFSSRARIEYDPSSAWNHANEHKNDTAVTVAA